jgi:hypothetical protein
MLKHLTIRPRRYGKTTEFAKYCKMHPDVIMIVLNEQQRDWIHHTFQLPLEQIATHDELLRGRAKTGLAIMRKRVLIDDADQLIKRVVGLNEIVSMSLTDDDSLLHPAHLIRVTD